MKKTAIIFAFVLALLAFGQRAWAQSYINVTTEAELIAAVQTNNAQIQFANDISTSSLLEIKNSRTITIDMNGFTLDRGCTSRGSQVIVVRTGSTLNLSNGTLTGGWGGNGGALDIEPGTTVNLTDVIITGNTADDHGVGIEENSAIVDEEIVTLVRIINVNGQTMTCKDVNELTPGIYILQGTNKDGKMVNKKIVVTKE